MIKSYYVYILTNKLNTVLYIGVTNDLIRRVWEHKQGFVEGFTKKYKVVKLVYYEMFNTPNEAIQREKQLKWWKRSWKEELINKHNPHLIDLYIEIAK